MALPEIQVELGFQAKCASSVAGAQERIVRLVEVTALPIESGSFTKVLKSRRSGRGSSVMLAHGQNALSLLEVSGSLEALGGTQGGSRRQLALRGGQCQRAQVPGFGHVLLETFCCLLELARFLESVTGILETTVLEVELRGAQIVAATDESRRRTEMGARPQVGLRCAGEHRCFAKQVRSAPGLPRELEPLGCIVSPPERETDLGAALVVSGELEAFDRAVIVLCLLMQRSGTRPIAIPFGAFRAQGGERSRESPADGSVDAASERAKPTQAVEQPKHQEAERKIDLRLSTPEPVVKMM